MAFRFRRSFKTPFGRLTLTHRGLSHSIRTPLGTFSKKLIGGRTRKRSTSASSSRSNRSQQSFSAPVSKSSGILATLLGLTVVGMLFCCGFGTVISAIRGHKTNALAELSKSEVAKPKATTVDSLPMPALSMVPKPKSKPPQSESTIQKIESVVAAIAEQKPPTVETVPKYQPRQWSDAQGKFKVEATLVSFQNDQVTIVRTDNGKQIPIPLVKLSTADQHYVRYTTEPRVNPTAEILLGPVTRTFEGDKLQVDDLQQGQVTIILAGIDAPALSEPFGNESRKHLASAVSGKQVRVEIVSSDAQGRAVGNVYVGEKSLNEDMVANGLAALTTQNEDGKLIHFEQQAKSKHVGMWGNYSRPPPEASPAKPKKTQSFDNSDNNQTSDVIVYVTNTGEKYHTGGCQYLRKSKIAMPLSRAKAIYSPCSRCGPPR